MKAALRRTTFWLLCAAVLGATWQGGKLSSLGTPARLLGLLATATGMLAVALHGRRERLSEVHLAVLALGGWALLSVFWSQDPAASFTYAGTVVQLGVLVLLAWEFGDLPQDTERLMTAYVTGCALSAVSVLTAPSAQLWQGRVSANGFNENDLGTTLALGIPMAWYLGARATSAVRTGVMSSYLVLGSLGVLLTGSRGSLVVLVIGLAVLPLGWRQTNRGTRVLVVAAIAVGVFAMASAVPPETAHRLEQTPTAATSSDLTGRVPLWKASLQIVEEHPLVGVGGGATPLAIERAISVRQSSHNTFLSIASGLGIVGLLLFCAVLVLTALRAWTLRGREATAVRVLLPALLVALLPLHWETQKPPWIVLAVVLGLVREHRPHRRPTPTPTRTRTAV